MSLKDAIKQRAYALGADLVGFGGIDRCKHAPAMMSPQGLFPGAQTVIVMGIHHPDACIELGGERHPQESGPYTVQYMMNERLDEMAYRLSTFIEESGYGVMPVASTNIWRYNTYKDLDAIFAPDISNIYMAVVAGLADIGYQGLALSPEYGARSRYITVITDAVLGEDPLIPPGSVCDQCMLCRTHCPTQALSKEIDGEKVLKIGEYEYRFPNKNLWRCAWGEHFDLDLDLEIPDVVTEEVIKQTVREHGSRAGEMGQCLKYCLPKTLRSYDRSYSTTPMRKHWVTFDESIEGRAVVDRLLATCSTRGAEHVIVSPASALREAGIDLDQWMPGAQSAVTLLTTHPDALDDPFVQGQAQYQMDAICYDLAREFDHLGFRSTMAASRSDQDNATRQIVTAIREFAGRCWAANTVVTRKVIPAQHRRPDIAPLRVHPERQAEEITRHITDYARELGADLVGVASCERMHALVEQLRPVYDGEVVLDAVDHSIRFMPWEPEVTQRQLRVLRPEDHLPGAKSLLVIGLRYHQQVLRWATRPPAEAVGPYAFQTYITSWLGAITAYRLAKRLQALGYAATVSMDVTGIDSTIANPREMHLTDLFGNRFAGVAAGLGYLTTSGHLATPDFGIRQRCVTIVTDAPLVSSALYHPGEEEYRCSTCPQPCITTCPTQAISERRISLTLEGNSYTFQKIDAKRCDWSKRYALPGESGFKYLGSQVDIPAPDAITPLALAEALRQHDAIQQLRPAVAEPCVINCPYGNDLAISTSCKPE